MASRVESVGQDRVLTLLAFGGIWASAIVMSSAGRAKAGLPDGVIAFVGSVATGLIMLLSVRLVLSVQRNLLEQHEHLTRHRLPASLRGPSVLWIITALVVTWINGALVATVFRDPAASSTLLLVTVISLVVAAVGVWRGYSLLLRGQRALIANEATALLHSAGLIDPEDRPEPGDERPGGSLV